MVTAAVLEQREPTAAPAIVAPLEQAPIMTLSSYGGKLTRATIATKSAEVQLPVDPSRPGKRLLAASANPQLQAVGLAVREERYASLEF